MRLLASIRRAAAVGRLVGWLTIGVALGVVRKRLDQQEERHGG